MSVIKFRSLIGEIISVVKFRGFFPKKKNVCGISVTRSVTRLQDLLVKSSAL